MKSSLALLIVAIFPGAALAQFSAIQPTDGAAVANPPEAMRPKVVKLSLAPAAEPRPALKYELLPPLVERKPGNAAPFYYRSLMWLAMRTSDLDKEYLEHEEAWTTAPLDQLNREALRKWVGAHRRALEELKTATHREYCEWDWRIQDMRGPETIGFLLEEAQRARDLARVLAVKARLEMAEGKLDEALETLRQGYQLGRDVGQPPLLITGLVGTAIMATMNNRLVELLDQPGAPNLYWALAALPQPMIDFRPAMRTEIELPEKLLPMLKDAETAERTPEEWQKLLRAAYQDLTLLGASAPSGNDFIDSLATAAALAKTYPVAKADLIAAGYDAQKLEKMPIAQVAAIQSARVIRYSYHEVFKCMLLPYPESAVRLKETNDRLMREGYLRPGVDQKDPLMLTGLLLPAVSAVNVASIRSARDLAAIQVLEAIRMHQAASDGKLPRTLDEIKVVPVPKNPATGEPFPYSVKGEGATLIVPSLSAVQSEGRLGWIDERDAIHYVITADKK